MGTQQENVVDADDKYLKPKEIVQITAKLLEQSQPLTTEIILKELEETGRAIRGADKTTYVSAILSRNDLFVARRKQGGWFLSNDDPLKDESPTTANSEALN